MRHDEGGAARRAPDAGHQGPGHQDMGCRKAARRDEGCQDWGRQDGGARTGTPGLGTPGLGAPGLGTPGRGAAVSGGEDVVVAIPARDEAERLPACLRALSAQAAAVPHRVLLLLNNTTDDTDDVLGALLPTLAMPVRVERVELPPERRHAGVARALSVNHAALLAGPVGVLLTTDADGVVAPDWLAANLRALRAGADAVCGRAVIDPEEARAIPEHLHADDAEECALAAALDELHARLDPDPHDLWPRHDEASGASLAVRAAALARAGGVPEVPLGEDRALVAALRREDFAVRHAPEVWVTVSGRLEGRAAGGMADTMRRRTVQQDEALDGRLEPAADAARRAAARHALRRLWPGTAAWPTVPAAALRHALGLADGAAPPDLAALAGALGLTTDALRALLGRPRFGQAWEATEREAPALRRREVPRLAIAGEMAAARGLLAGLRGR